MKTLSLFISFLFTLTLFSQDPDPRVFSDWYITEFIGDGVSYFPPEPYPIEILNEGDELCPYYFHIPNHVDSGGSGCLEIFNENEFIVLGLGGLAEPAYCFSGEIQDCWDFFVKYYPLYEDALMNGEHLSYQIIDLQNDKRSLVVSNLEGDQAIYSNQYLSIDEVTKHNIIVFPNPVENLLFINSQFEIEKVIVYSIEGKMTLETSSKTIDFSNLRKGMYFIKILYNNRVEFHKILKN